MQHFRSSYSLSLQKVRITRKQKSRHYLYQFALQWTDAAASSENGFRVAIYFGGQNLLHFFCAEFRKLCGNQLLHCE